MTKGSFKKGMLLLLALAIVVSTLVQSCIPVRGTNDSPKFIVDFGEHKDNQRGIRVTNSNIFEITDVLTDNGNVVYEVYGAGDIGITVFDGVKTTAERPVTSEAGFPDIKKIPDTIDNKFFDKDSELLFEGSLSKINEDPVQRGSQYFQKYEGVLTNPNAYKYKVTISYIENKLPEIAVTAPKADSFAGKVLNVEYTVNDENVGDKLDVFYSIDDDKSTGILLRGDITSNGSEQTFNDKINIDPAIVKENDTHKLYVWVVDKNGKKSKLVTRQFIADYTAPKDPTFELSPKEDTNKSVTVGIYYSDTDTDIVTKEFRIDDGEWKPFGKEIVLDKNGTVETRATDRAGNSTITLITITNIDKNKPTAPSIAVSAAETVSQPITVTITSGEDKESGIKTTEYCLGSSNSDWKKYDAQFKITNIGETTIRARSIDKAGNISDTAVKTVTIKSGGNSNPGNNIPPAGGNQSVPGPSSTQTVATPTPAVVQDSTKIPGVEGPPADLAVYLTSDKTTYGENETVNFLVSYRNKSSVNTYSTVIKADIPQYTTVLDSSGGTVNGSQIEWKVGNLLGGASGEIKFKVKVGLLDKAEIELKNKAVISSLTLLDKTEDDESFYRLMLYSNRYDKKSHQFYIVGYKDNTFRPELSITRAEVAAMLVRVLNLGEGTPDKITYKDFTKKHWAYGYIYSATKYGLFEGYEDNAFNPDSYITRAELSTALARYLKLKNIEPGSVHFSDITNHWARNYIEEIYRLNLIEGYKDGNFMPNSQIKRCETVTIIDRMLCRGPLKGADASFTDVKKNHWAYGHIVESCTDHYYTRNMDGSETKVSKDN